MGNPQLLDLARRPVMNEHILEALPDIGAGKPVDLSRVYLYAVRNKMERAIKEERTFTSLADKLYFLCELSWEMLLTNQMSLNYRLFPDRLQRLFGPVVQEKKDMDHWHYDMMGQTMLIRNDDGDYTPAHRSLREFFVAYKFTAEMGVLASDFTELARSQSHVNKGIQSHKYTWSSYFERRVDEKGKVRLIPPLEEFLVEDTDKLVTTVGKRPITKAVLDLMQNMLVQDRQEVNFQLLTIIGNTQEKVSEEVGFLGGNAATLLIRHDPLALRRQNLPYVNLNYTDFDNADLTGCNLQGANLQYAKFGDAILEDVNLCDGDLTHAEFAEIKGVSSIAFNPNGKSLASGGDDIYIYALC